MSNKVVYSCVNWLLRRSAQSRKKTVQSLIITTLRPFRGFAALRFAVFRFRFHHCRNFLFWHFGHFGGAMDGAMACGSIGTANDPTSQHPNHNITTSHRRLYQQQQQQQQRRPATPQPACVHACMETRCSTTRVCCV